MDFATKTFRTAQPTEARFLDLTPETQTVPTTGVAAVTATVTDRSGIPVPNVSVAFSEDGTGRFTNGSNQTGCTTGAQGTCRVELSTTTQEGAGSTTVTGTIRTTATANDEECEQLANNTGRTGGINNTNNNAPGAAAGRCTDTAAVTFGNGSPSPSASTPVSPGASTPASPGPSGSATPSGPPAAACTVPATISLDRSTIIATGSAVVTVRATPNSVIDLFAYSRPSTTFRVARSAELGADGTTTFRIVPPTNTRLYVQQRGCNASPSIVLNVRTQISLDVVRNGVRNYTFSGRLLPARPGGLIASLYRVTNDGRQILTAQTRANASDGRYTIVRQFTGSGRFGFVVRTGQDLQNAPGSSNVRSLAVF